MMQVFPKHKLYTLKNYTPRTRFRCRNCTCNCGRRDKIEKKICMPRRYIRSRGDEKSPKFHVDMKFWISCFPLGARIRHVDMKLDMTIGNPKWNSKKQYYFFIINILAIVQDIYIDYRKFFCT